VEFAELVSRFALALGIGLLIGLERGWRTRELRAGSRTAGIRTFAISGLLGGTIGGLAHTLGGAASAGGGLLIGFAFAAYSVVMAVFCRAENRAERTFSATTLIAAMATFALGAYALIGDMRAAAALAVAAAIILALREPIHGWVERLTWAELRSGLVLLAMTFVALPILPDGTIGPFGGVNPREVWLIAIVLAGVSFAGYAAVKYFGLSRGLLLAGAAGGLASSTAVTIASARRAAARQAPAHLLAAGVALASAVMFLRAGAIVAALNASLLPIVAPVLVAAAAAAAAYAVNAVYWRRHATYMAEALELGNPFEFWSVIGFAVFLGVIIMAGRAVGEWFGATGAIAGAAVVGLVDVEAITVSLSRLAPDLLSTQAAAVAILAAVASSTAGKVGIGALIGGVRFAAELATMTLACFLFGAVALWMTLALQAA
jgi:uncharacterized membrane protein (DUF4010 family)